MNNKIDWNLVIWLSFSLGIFALYTWFDVEKEKTKQLQLQVELQQHEKTK